LLKDKVGGFDGTPFGFKVGAFNVGVELGGGTGAFDVGVTLGFKLGAFDVGAPLGFKVGACRKLQTWHPPIGTGSEIRAHEQGAYYQSLVWK
jgi:hypothetical protein